MLVSLLKVTPFLSFHYKHVHNKYVDLKPPLLLLVLVNNGFFALNIIEPVDPNVTTFLATTLGVFINVPTDALSAYPLSLMTSSSAMSINSIVVIVIFSKDIISSIGEVSIDPVSAPVSYGS